MSPSNGSDLTVLEHADWGDVMRKLNGKVQHPIELNVWFVTVLGLLCAVAFQPNVELFYRIVRDKMLRQKPRYIIKPFTFGSSLLVLF